MQIGSVLGEAWGLYKRFFWKFFLTAFVVYAVLDLFSALANAAAGDSFLAGLFWGLIAATCVVLYFMASFFPNQDGVWHQTAVRDTALTPSHIVMFFWAFPLGITMTVGCYLYGRTRLPAIYSPDKGFPWSFGLLIAASVTEMMQVAMNEWGHSLWITEEIFAAPFHWPFVTYGWLASGIFALWAESLGRLLQIEDELEEEQAPALGAEPSVA